jgi:hypothetical protein
VKKYFLHSIEHGTRNDLQKWKSGSEICILMARE